MSSRSIHRRALLAATVSSLAGAALGCGSDTRGRDPAASGSADKGSGAASGSASGRSSAAAGGLSPTIRDALTSAAALTIRSLNPLPSAASATPSAAARGSASAAPSYLHGFLVTGSATLTDASSREKLIATIDRGIREHDGSIAACFNPRHAVSAAIGNRSVDLVICFECRQLEIWDGDTRMGALTSRSVEPEVSAIFRAAGLSIAG